MSGVKGISTTVRGASPCGPPARTCPSDVGTGAHQLRVSSNTSQVPEQTRSGGRIDCRLLSAGYPDDAGQSRWGRGGRCGRRQPSVYNFRKTCCIFYGTYHDTVILCVLFVPRHDTDDITDVSIRSSCGRSCEDVGMLLLFGRFLSQDGLYLFADCELGDDVGWFFAGQAIWSAVGEGPLGGGNFFWTNGRVRSRRRG